MTEVPARLACRTGEAIGATWQEIDAESRLWHIPGTRMKAGRDHRVPFSGAAMGLLDRLNPAARAPAPGFDRRERVFPISNMAMAMLMRRMGRGDLTVHGFRSTFATWCKDVGVAAEVHHAYSTRHDILALFMGPRTSHIFVFS